MRAIDFGRLRVRLLKGGVAPKYVKRMLQEMRQHLEELQGVEQANGASEAEARAEAFRRLGDEDQLVSETLGRQELQALSRRYPKSAFIVLPVLVYFLIALFSLSVALGGVMELFNIELRENWPSWHVYYSKIHMFFMEYLLAPGLALFVAVTAVRRNVQMLWPTLGILLVCFFGLGFDTNISVPDERGRGGIDLIWGWPFLPWEMARPPWPQSIEQLLRWAATIGATMLVFYRYRPYGDDPQVHER